MNLRAYTSKTKIKDAALASAVGVSRGYITQLRLGIRKRPSLSVALKIEKATDGEVPAKIWGVA